MFSSGLWGPSGFVHVTSPSVRWTLRWTRSWSAWYVRPVSKLPAPSSLSYRSENQVTTHACVPRSVATTSILQSTCTPPATPQPISTQRAAPTGRAAYHSAGFAVEIWFGCVCRLMVLRSWRRCARVGMYVARMREAEVLWGQALGRVNIDDRRTRQVMGGL